MADVYGWKGFADNDYVSTTYKSEWMNTTTTDDWDIIHTYEGNDTIYAGGGDDELYGGEGDDALSGDTGVDKLYGEAGADSFYFFGEADTGDVFANQADTIYDFETQDQILLLGTYTYAGDTSMPADGQFSIWQNVADWIVTYNTPNDDGWHDIVVKGDVPQESDITSYIA